MLGVQLSGTDGQNVDQSVHHVGKLHGVIQGDAARRLLTADQNLNGKIAANYILNGREHLQHKSGTVSNAASVFIGALVAQGREKMSEASATAIGRMDGEHIKAQELQCPRHFFCFFNIIVHEFSGQYVAALAPKA